MIRIVFSAFLFLFFSCTVNAQAWPSKPVMLERLDALAFEHVGGTQQQFSAYVKAEIAKWGRVVREGNIKAE